MDINEIEQHHFTKVMELVDEHGNRELLECLARNAEFDAEDTDLSPEYREDLAYLHLELSQLLVRYDRLFPELEEAPEEVEEEQQALRFYPVGQVPV